jgi:hypothetical protein
MKRRSLVIVGFSLVLAAVTITFFRINSEISTAAKPRPTIVAANGMKLSTNTDPVDVFRRAFWRHPTGDDQILNAERREWTGKGGVQKWQWFIAVRPGSQLLDWLEKNPFSMKLSTSPVPIESPPAWYPQSTGNFQVYVNAEGSFILMLSADRKYLYASDSGLGFTAPGEAP